MMKPTKPISLEDLIVLNDEIAALVRAGIPLDRGLLATGSDMPGRLGDLTTAVAMQLGRGSSILEAIEAERTDIPDAYRAVVAAGIRSGRLAAATESVAGHLRRLAQSRREISMALVYPVMIVVLAWCVGFFLFTTVLPGVHVLVNDVTSEKSLITTWLPAFRNAWIWLGAIPCLLLLLVLWIWRGSSRAVSDQNARAMRVVSWIPWMGRMIRTSRLAIFTDVMAMLVEAGVPLTKGIVLAAKATGSGPMIESARAMTARIEAGESLDRDNLRKLAIPPLLSWTIASGLHHQRLVAALEHAAKTYRRRARHTSEMARLFLPIVFTVCLGGLAVAISALGLFIPYSSMLHELSKVW
jgi:general secretion pathway protein F